MTEGANLFADAPAARSPGEQITEIFARPGLRIERIVSTGQASPPGFWYDQPLDEWVAVLSGAAILRFENEPDARRLAAGDHIFIPAHARHRVDWTSADQATVWLAVHIRPEE
jgi:cupin 2 domain-containing protein